MSIIGSNILAGASGQAGGGGAYEIERSVRFNSADSAYLSRTPASAGNRKTWTWAGWVKGVATSENPHLFTCTTGSTDATYFRLWFVSDGIRVSNYNSTLRQTSAVYRDPSAWYHIVLAVDTTQATAANRIKLYVNGSEVTAFSSSVNPNQNDDLGINQASAHSIGATSAGGGNFSGYLADIHFIDGQALTPSSFGEFDTNGVWQPIDYAGSFGTNGFHLPFSDNSTAAALGTDTSGNSNTWTVNNISVTAGAGNDSVVDSPTNYGTDTGAGGEVRGNYATFNPLSALPQGTITYSNGNLEVAEVSSAYRPHVATIAISTGKFYWEFTKTAGVTDDNAVGVLPASTSGLVTIYDNSFIYYRANGTRVRTGTTQASGAATWGVNDVMGVALNMDAGEIAFYKNGVLQVGVITGVSTTTSWLPFCGDDRSATNTSWLANFGQRPFAYTAPSGFKALCTANLPEPTIADGSTVMDVKLYTGNGSTQTISGLNFSPDLVWIKVRDNARSNFLFDTVRGVEKYIISNTTGAEVTDNTYLTTFSSTGFSVGSSADVNRDTSPIVAWTWDAGSSTVTNTQGSITSQVRANASAGFSVSTFTKNANTNETIGHGLGVAPTMVIVKTRESSGYTGWAVYHVSTGSNGYLELNTTSAFITLSTTWNNTAPTSSVFTMGTGWTSTQNMVAYCFAPVAGYSNGFSYTGNGSTDGSFVYLGFRPRLILLKCSSTTGNWTLLDTAREGYNVDNDPLYPNLSNAEGTTDLLDITSNGFKLRTTDASVNSSGATYVGFAWAETPFAYSRAR